MKVRGTFSSGYIHIPVFTPMLTRTPTIRHYLFSLLILTCCSALPIAGYAATPNASAPKVSSFVIDGGKTATNSRKVSISLAATGSVTHYIISQDKNFAGTNWKPFDSSFSFILSPSFGKKQVYLAVKGKSGISAKVTRTIHYLSNNTPWILDFKLANGAPESANRKINISWKGLGKPTYYQLSESKYFTGQKWRKLLRSPSIELSPFSGKKTVYFRVKNKTAISARIAKSITLKENDQLLLSSVIEPSSKSQRINISPDLSIEIPGRLLKKSAKLTIKSNPLPAKFPVSAFKALATYDITLGDMHDFSAKPLKLEYRYNPASLSTQHAPEVQLYSTYWDDATKQWALEPVLVYRNENKVVVNIKHLSPRTISAAEGPISIGTRWYSRSIYDTRILAPFGGIDSYAAKASGYVEDAIRAYKDAGFKIPSSQIVVAVFDFGPERTAEYGSGMICVPTTYYDDDELKFALYHEVFHAIQNEYMSIPSMYLNRWFIEATADYAAAAHSGLPAEMGKHLKHRFLETSLTSDPDIDDQHKYQVAHFIKYFASASFKDMFIYVANASWYESTLSAWDAFMQSRGYGSLAGKFQEFARYYIFDASSPIPPLEDSLHSEVAVNPVTLGYGVESVDAELSLNKEYSAKLWGIWVESDDNGYRYLEASVDGSLPSRVAIDVFNVTDDHNRSGGLVGTITKTNRKVRVRLNQGQSLYLLATNVSAETATLKLKVSDIAPKVTRVEPEVASWGDQITIYGKGFGESRSNSYVFGLSEKQGISYTKWSDEQIQFTLPVTLPGSREISVKREDGVIDSYLPSDTKPIAVDIAPALTAKLLYGFGFTGRHSYVGNCPNAQHCPEATSVIDGSYGALHSGASPLVIQWSGRSFSGSVTMTTTSGFNYSSSVTGQIDEYGKTLSSLAYTQTWSKTSMEGYKTFLHTGDIGWTATNLPLYLHDGSNPSPITYIGGHPTITTPTADSFIANVRDNVVEKEEVCDNPPVNTVNCRWTKNFSKTYTGTNSSEYWQVGVSFQ